MPGFIKSPNPLFPLFGKAPRPRRTPREHTPTNQTAGAKARETALQTVERGASRQWKDKALEAVRVCCLENVEFLADLVWEYLDEKPPEPRAMGAVMRKAEKAGYCSKTDTFRPTTVVSNHRAPKRVWLSNIYEGSTD